MQMPDTWKIFLLAFIIDITAESYYMCNYKINSLVTPYPQSHGLLTVGSMGWSPSFGVENSLHVWT